MRVLGSICPDHDLQQGVAGLKGQHTHCKRLQVLCGGVIKGRILINKLLGDALVAICSAQWAQQGSVHTMVPHRQCGAHAKVLKLTCGAKMRTNSPLLVRSLTTAGSDQMRRSLNQPMSSSSLFREAARKACRHHIRQ